MRVALFSLTLASAAVLLAQQDPLDIMRRAVTAANRSETLRDNYTYTVLNEIRELNNAGNVISTRSNRREAMFIKGRLYRRLLEADGRTLTPAEAKTEQERVDFLVRQREQLSASERKKQDDRSARNRATQRAQIEAIPDAFLFKLKGETILNGRPAWEIRASPKPDYKGKEAFLMRHIEGTIWIDKENYEWVKAEADALDTISFGWFVARIAKGARISVERVRVNDELWAMKHMKIRVAARLMLLKKLNEEREQTFSNYRKFQTDSRFVPTEEPIN